MNRSLPAVLLAGCLLAVAGCSSDSSDDVSAVEACTTAVPTPFAEPAGKGLSRAERKRLTVRVVEEDRVREPSVTAQTVTMLAVRGEECSSIVEKVNGTIDPQLETADYQVRTVTNFRGERLDFDSTTDVLIVDGTVGYDKPGGANGYEKTDETVESLRPNPFGTMEWDTLLGGATAVHQVNRTPEGDTTYLVTVPLQVLNNANVTLRDGWRSPAGSLLTPKVAKRPVRVLLTVEKSGRPVAYSMVVDTTDVNGDADGADYIVATEVEWDHYGVRAIRPAPAW